jgi:hypothetical protein
MIYYTPAAGWLQEPLCLFHDSLEEPACRVGPWYDVLHIQKNTMCLVFCADTWHGYITVRTYIYRWMSIIIHIIQGYPRVNAVAAFFALMGISQISVVEVYIFMHELVRILIQVWKKLSVLYEQQDPPPPMREV